MTPTTGVIPAYCFTVPPHTLGAGASMEGCASGTAVAIHGHDAFDGSGVKDNISLTFQNTWSIAGQIERPQSVGIDVLDEPETPLSTLIACASMSDEIRLPRQCLELPDYAIPNPVLAHELGHILFDKNFSRFVESTLSFETKVRQLSRNSQAAKQDLGPPRADIEYITRSARLEDAENLLNIWHMGLGALLLIQGFSELFADLVAVLVCNDPSCIAQNMRFHKVEEMIPPGCAAPILNGRDFNHDSEVDGWQWADRHLFFAPTRSFLGRLIYSSGEKCADKNRMLILALSAMAEVLGNLLPGMSVQDVLEGEDSFITQFRNRVNLLTPEEANRLIIEKMRQIFLALQFQIV